MRINSLHILVDILFLKLRYLLQWVFSLTQVVLLLLLWVNTPLGCHGDEQRLPFSFLCDWESVCGLRLYQLPPLSLPSGRLNGLRRQCYLSIIYHMVVSCLVICEWIITYQLHNAYLSQLNITQIFKFWFKIFANSCIYQLEELTSDNW